MNGKRIIILLMMLILLGMSQTEAAEENQQPLPSNSKLKITCLYGFVGSEGNDAIKAHSRIFKRLKERAAVTFSGEYEFVDGDKYIEKFAQKGIHDFLYLEKNYIIDEFKDTDIDHIIVITLVEMLALRHVTHLKIFDVKKNQYEYTGSFSRVENMLGDVGNFSKTYDDMEETIFKKLFPKIKIVRS